MIQANVFFIFNAEKKAAVTFAVLMAIYKKRKSAAVLCEDEQTMQQLDKFLWTCQQREFLPHVMIDDPLVAETPIILSDKYTPLLYRDFLVTLKPQVIPEIHTKPHACMFDIVTTDPKDRQYARERVACYRDSGFNISHIDCTNPEYLTTIDLTIN